MSKTTPAQDLTPGRDADARVAVAVFGFRWWRDARRNLCRLVAPEDGNWINWNWSPELPGEYLTHWPGEDERFTDWRTCVGRDTQGQAAHYLPQWSTDLTVAMTLLRSVRRFETCRDHRNGDTLTVVLPSGSASAPITGDDPGAVGRAMALTICKAVLAAAGENRINGGTR